MNYAQRWVLVYKKRDTCAIGLDDQDDGDQGSDMRTVGISRLRLYLHGPTHVPMILYIIRISKFALKQCFLFSYMPRNSKNV